MLITIIITSALISFICCYLISRAYEQHLDWYEQAWQRQRQRQTIFFQFARIEELEVERETLHGIAIKALELSTPDVEEYHSVGGLEFTVWRN